MLLRELKYENIKHNETIWNNMKQYEKYENMFQYMSSKSIALKYYYALKCPFKENNGAFFLYGKLAKTGRHQKMCKKQTTTASKS